jgi:hypothetical protein
MAAQSRGRWSVCQQDFVFASLDGCAITIYDRDAPAEGWDHIGSIKR